jgi:CRP-like cAMP-binding protein
VDETKIKLIGKPAREVITFLSNIPIFGKLSYGELETITPFMGYLEVRQGELLFKEGQEGNYVFFVSKGILDVYKASASGGEVVIASLSKGLSIGEMAIIDTFPRSATVKARTDARVLVITRTGFNRILEGHATVGIKILQGIARLLTKNLRKTSTRLVDYMLPLN